ncbi:MAG TPA: Cof-type HAD-IIB family hydrolase [Candidatus Eisenbergiella intestinipullorum]|nr:Cof-type HAD-IIB family hydrolase [Candidatus Eisenbergiella intestinipullorum]
MKQSEYELIALDMDGTLLDSSQRITPRARAAVRRILEQGRQVTFATGRCRTQLTQYLEYFPKMRYLICENGACICDLKEGKDLFRRSIAVREVRHILGAVEKEDVLITLFIGNRSFLGEGSLTRLEEFGLESYRPVFAESAVVVEDLFSFYRSRPLEVEKVSLFFRNGTGGGPARMRVQERVRRLPLSIAVSAPGNLELTAENVNKGTGLELLCGFLKLPLSAAVAVGDGGNDMQLLRTAGLGVAMENAPQALRAAAQAVVPDCDHEGAAIAMERYLLR